MAIDPAAMKKMAADYAAAWSSGSPEAVGAHYAEDGPLSVNRGDMLTGRQAILERAAAFCADFPDLTVRCDDIRLAGDHAIYLWTLEGRHATTKNFVRVGGWEEWDLTDDLKVKSSLGWFDAADYGRQVAGGTST